MNERMILERACEVGLRITFHVQARSLRDAGGLGFPAFTLTEYCGTIDGFMPIEIPKDQAKELKTSFGQDSFSMILKLDDGVEHKVTIPYAFVSAIQTVHGVQEWTPKGQQMSLIP